MMITTMVRSNPMRIGVSRGDCLLSVCSCSSTAGMNKSVMNTRALWPFWFTAYANSLSESGLWMFGNCSRTQLNVVVNVGSSELVRFILKEMFYF